MMAVIHTNLPKQKQIDQGAKQRLLPWRSERRKGSISHMDRQTASRKPRCCKLLRILTLNPHHRSYTYSYSYVRDAFVYVQVDSLSRSSAYHWRQCHAGSFIRGHVHGNGGA